MSIFNIITHPTQAEHVSLFEKMLKGRFSCINTRLAFDLQILLPKDKVDNHKPVFDLKANNVNEKKKDNNKDSKDG